MLVLDTSAAIEILRGTKRGAQIKEALKNEKWGITAVTVHELLFGMREMELERTTEFIFNCDVLDFDTRAAFESSRIKKELRKKGMTIDEIDLLISGICFSRNGQLVTFDEHFSKIDGLSTKRMH